MDFIKISHMMKERYDEEWKATYEKHQEARKKLCEVITKELELDKLGFRATNISEINHTIHIWKYDAPVEEVVAILEDPEVIERFGKRAEYFKYEVRGTYRGYPVTALCERRGSVETVA